MGWTAETSGVTLEMTEDGSKTPMADTAGEALVIDGTITKDGLERFMTSHS
jgi:hypothetical protein